MGVYTLNPRAWPSSAGSPATAAPSPARRGLEVGVLKHDESGDRLPIVGDHNRAAPGRLPNVGCQGLGRVGHLYSPDRHSSNSFLPIRTRFRSLIPIARMSTLRSGSSST